MTDFSKLAEALNEYFDTNPDWVRSDHGHTGADAYYNPSWFKGGMVPLSLSITKPSTIGDISIVGRFGLHGGDITPDNAELFEIIAKELYAMRDES